MIKFTIKEKEQLLSLAKYAEKLPTIVCPFRCSGKFLCCLQCNDSSLFNGKCTSFCRVLYALVYDARHCDSFYKKENNPTQEEFREQINRCPFIKYIKSRKMRKKMVAMLI